MAKKIISSFERGLWAKERNLPDGFVFSGIGTNIYRFPGFLTSDDAVSADVMSNDSVASDLDSIVAEQVADNTNSTAYLFTLGASGKVFRIKNTITTPTPDRTFVSTNDYVQYSANTPIAVRAMIATIVATPTLLWGYQESSGSSYLAKGSLTSTFSLSATYKTLSGQFKDLLESAGFVWCACGRYIDKFDPLTETISVQAFDLGVGWSADCLFSTPTYLGIFASKNGVDSRCIMWDRVSSNEIRSIPLRGVTQVIACRNVGGVIRFVASTGRAEQTNAVLTNNGYSVNENERLRQDINGSLVFPTINVASLHVFDNKLLMGTTYGLVLSFDGKVVTNLFTNDPTSSGSWITSIKTLYATNGRLGFGGIDSGSNYFYKYVDITIGSNPTHTSAMTYKDGYIDMGQTVRINYIKFYFKPLASGDSVTPTMDLDYGTSYILKDPRGNTAISYALDGAVTTKRFNLGILAHAFRPVINGIADSKIAFSKIVIDYSFTPDDY